MKSLLAKIALYKTVGLYLGEREATVSKVAVTPLGPIEIASSSEPYTTEDLPGVIERLLRPLVGRKCHLPVAVGLSSSRLFFSTRLTAAGGTASPEAMLQRALCSSNICIDDLTVELRRSEVNKSPVASVAACRKKYIAGVVATLARLGVRPFRAEPGPCALVRLAAQQYRAPRRSKSVLRVFLGAEHGLAVAVAGGLPLAWRQFAIPAGSEGFAILSACRALQTQEKHYGVESSLDYAIIHGRTDLHERLQQEQFASNLGTRVIWQQGPEFNGASVALGLALGCAAQSDGAFDLSRSLKARASIREIFPWWDLAFAAAMVAFMAIVLGAHSMKLDDSHALVQAQSSGHKCLATAVEPGLLEKQTKDLEQKVEAVRRFLGTRIQWSAYTRDISTRLPKNAQLTMFEVFNDLDCGGSRNESRGLRKSFQLQVQAPYVNDANAPREIDMVLTELRNHPLLKRDFPSVELSGIKRIQAIGRETPSAVFTIIGLPGAPGVAAAPASNVGKDEKKGAK